MVTNVPEGTEGKDRGSRGSQAKAKGMNEKSEEGSFSKFEGNDQGEARDAASKKVSRDAASIKV